VLSLKNLDNLSLFLTIVECGSLTSASRMLSLPKSKLSRRLALLESELGSQLLVRTTRSQQLTEIGEQLFRTCKPHVEALKSAEASVSDFISLPKGKLKILLPLEFFNQVMAELISEFAMLYPNISVHCQHYSQAMPEQDLSFDLIFVLHEQTLPASNWIAKTLLSFPQAIYCATTSFQSEKRTPEELIESKCILSQENQLWLFRGRSNTTAIEPKAFMVLSSPEMRLAAVKRNLGLAKLPEYLVQGDNQSQLVKPVQLTCAPVAQQLSILYQSRSIPKKTRVFLDFFQSNIGCF
jgi:DNA-binding transcriptional LysR family regulator